MTAALLLALAALTLNSLAHSLLVAAVAAAVVAAGGGGFGGPGGGFGGPAVVSAAPAAAIAAAVGVQSGRPGGPEAQRQAEGSDQEPERQVQRADAGVAGPDGSGPADRVGRRRSARQGTRPRR